MGTQTWGLLAMGSPAAASALGPQPLSHYGLSQALLGAGEEAHPFPEPLWQGRVDCIGMNLRSVLSPGTGVSPSPAGRP